MSESRNKFRAAIDVLQQGRDVLVESLADEILEQGDDLADGGFLFHEFLEAQGTRLHFLGLIMAQLEQSAESLDESQRIAAMTSVPEVPPEPKPVTKRKRSRSKKLQQTSPEGRTDEA
jgi:hypothetical protein